mgnify:CR=1 FL=1
MAAFDGERRSLSRRVRQAVTERLTLKIAAIFFACVLWLVVSAEEPTEQVVQLVVSPRMDSTLVLVGRRPIVRALVVGRARELLELAADPPVARPLVQRAGDSVEVPVAPGDVEVPTNVQVIVREIRPRSVTIQVARIARPLAPATAAESALAGLVLPRVQADTARSIEDTVDLDTLALRGVQRDSVRPDTARGPARREPARRPR